MNSSENSTGSHPLSCLNACWKECSFQMFSARLMTFHQSLSSPTIPGCNMVLKTNGVGKAFRMDNEYTMLLHPKLTTMPSFWGGKSYHLDLGLTCSHLLLPNSDPALKCPFKMKPCMSFFPQRVGIGHISNNSMLLFINRHFHYMITPLLISRLLLQLHYKPQRLAAICLPTNY